MVAGARVTAGITDNNQLLKRGERSYGGCGCGGNDGGGNNGGGDNNGGSGGGSGGGGESNGPLI